MSKQDKIKRMITSHLGDSDKDQMDKEEILQLHDNIQGALEHYKCDARMQGNIISIKNSFEEIKKLVEGVEHSLKDEHSTDHRSIIEILYTLADTKEMPIKDFDYKFRSQQLTKECIKSNEVLEALQQEAGQYTQYEYYDDDWFCIGDVFDQVVDSLYNLEYAIRSLIAYRNYINTRLKLEGSTLGDTQDEVAEEGNNE